MAQNGHDPLSAAIAQAHVQQQAEQAMEMMLQSCLNQPAIATRVLGPKKLAVATDGAGTKMLLIALPTGERWDVPIDPATAQRLSRELAGAVILGADDAAAPESSSAT